MVEGRGQCLAVFGRMIGRGKRFFSKSIQIYKTNKNMKTFFKSVGVAVLVGLWAWQHGSTNLRCVHVSGVCILNLNLLAFIVPEIATFIRTDRVRTTRLLILIKNI